MRRSIIFLLAAGVFAVAAPAARAKSTCSVPDEPAWHSCLTARHATLSTGSVRLTRATPALVVRLQHGCPDRLAKRRVVLRTKAGTRIAAEKVTGSCRTDVARYRVHVRPDLELPAGTVIRSYWSGIRDDKLAPKVRIGAG